MSLINPVKVVKSLRTLFSTDQFLETTEWNVYEKRLCDSLLKLITNATSAATFEMIPDTTYEFRGRYETSESEEMTALTIGSSSSSSPSPPTLAMEQDVPSTSAVAESSTSETEGPVDMDYKRLAVAYWRNLKPSYRTYKQSRSLRSVRKKFPHVKSISQLQDWMNSLRQDRTPSDKLKQIAEKVLNKFTEEASVSTVIHDVDLRSWANEANKEVQLDNFIPSSNWLDKFKKRNNIVQRKVYKFIVRSEKNNLTTENLEQTQLFLQSMRDLRMSEMDVANVYNAAVITFKTYSLILMISAEGRLITPLTIILEAAKVTNIQATLEYSRSFSNLHVIMSRSNRLTTSNIKQWFEKVYLKSTGVRTCLILNDKLARHKELLVPLIPRYQKVKIEPIPVGMESILEPLSEGLKLWNRFVAAINDYIDVNSQYGFDRHSIENIIKIQAFAHHQLTADRYRSSFIGAWYKCGLLDEDDLPLVAIDPVVVGFGTDQQRSGCFMCNNESFISCSRCKKLICFQHALMLGAQKGMHYDL
ncbi:uncharacterized protein MD21A_iyMicDemo21aOGSv2.0-000276 [Microplitis demolitor]